MVGYFHGIQIFVDFMRSAYPRKLLYFSYRMVQNLMVEILTSKEWTNANTLYHHLYCHDHCLRTLLY